MSIFCEIVSPGRKKRVNGGEIEPGWAHPYPPGVGGVCLPEGMAGSFPHLISINDFQIVIAIVIPIKNYSGKIADRFSFQKRSAISGSKTGPDFSHRS
jgi:hypothetical protein